MMHILAIDLGTQNIKAALVTPGGRIAHIGETHQEVMCPQPGWAQQSPSEWWEKVCAVIRNLLKDSGVAPEEVAAVCSCGQMHGPVGIGEDGKVTTDWVQLWCDKRSEEQCARIRWKTDEEMVLWITANPVTTGWVGPKIAWLRDNAPDVYDRTRWFLVPKDFVNFKLSGVAATDPSEASGTFVWDSRSDTYSDAMARILGLDVGKFAPVFRSYDRIGEVTEEASRQTGLARGTPVIAGGGDFIVSLLGLGLCDRDTAVDISGTSTLFAGHEDEPVMHPGIFNLRHVLDGWVPFVMLDCGGLSMKWCRGLFSSFSPGDLSYETMIEAAEAVNPGSEGLLFYPYLLGERRPDNAGARGCFYGITLAHTGPHFVRSVMEGVALALLMNVNVMREHGMTITRLYCSGGGARNRLWNRIKADVLQIPVVAGGNEDATLRGAGLLGAYGVHLIDDIEAACKEGLEETRVIEPDPENAAVYEAEYVEFKRLYDHMLGYGAGAGPACDDEQAMNSWQATVNHLWAPPDE